MNIISLILGAALCVFVYRGANWARWILGLHFVVLGIVLIYAGVARPETQAARLLGVIGGLVYVAAAATLLSSPHVRSYFRWVVATRGQASRR